MSQIVFQKDWFAVFKIKVMVTVNDHIIKIWLSYISSELLILLQRNLVWWHIIISWIVLWKDWIFVVVKVKVTEKVQNSSECSSEWYLLCCWTFCNQTWYGDATSWAKVSCKIGLLSSSSSGSQRGLIWKKYMTVSTIFAELLNLNRWYIIISWSVLCQN